MNGFVLAAAVGAWASAALAAPVRVGSKKFTESYVLGEIATRTLGARSIPAEHRSGMGGTLILWQALRSGAIDSYPEYTGTIAQEIVRDPRRSTVAAIRPRLAALGIGITEPLGFNNTYALVMRRARARALHVATISDLIADRLQPQRLAVAVLGWLGALAALVAVLGVSSLVASGVAQRTHEIGVRVSLGASRARVLALVARQGLIPLAAGGAGGLLAAALARNLIRAFLRDIGPLDPGSFAAAAGLLLGAAGLGVGVAAWRALSIDPATALRAE